MKFEPAAVRGVVSTIYDDRDPALLPCPFCGAPSHHLEVLNTHTPAYWVACMECGAEMYGQSAEGHYAKRAHRRAFLSAIAAWNRRTP
jgi:capsular polysaccharide biosynthesis protein